MSPLSPPRDPHPERTARLVECWRADEPGERELSQARSRHRLGQLLARRRPRLRPLVWALLTLLVAGGAYAAGAVLLPVLEAPWQRAEEPPEATPAAPARRQRREAAPAPAEVPLDEPPVVEAPVDAPILEAPATLPERRPARSAPEAPATLRSPTRLPSTSAADTPTGGPWGQVNDALRHGDAPAAERALEPLIDGGDAATRDAARLLAAQIWIRQGRTERARRELQRLATSGATRSVRRQSRQLLESL
jgi:hypothetical protein